MDGELEPIESEMAKNHLSLGSSDMLLNEIFKRGRRGRSGQRRRVNLTYMDHYHKTSSLTLRYTEWRIVCIDANLTA